MSDELNAILITQVFMILVTLIGVGIPALSQWRKWRTGEREQVNSSAEKAEAETVNIWQKTYEELRQMLVLHDKEMAELRESDSRHALEMNSLRIEIENLKAQLELKTASEKTLREENAQLKMDLMQERSQRQLESTLSNQKIADLETEVKDLKAKIEALKRETQNA